MATTLYDYYTGQGQKLPTVQERSKIYEAAGLGTGYQGTAQQNTALLNYLQKPVNVSPTVNATDLGNTPTPIVPPPEAPIDTAANLVNGANAGMTETQKQIAQAKADEAARLKASMDNYNTASMIQGTNPAETTYNQSVQDLLTLTKTPIDRAGDYKKLLESSGVNANQARLNELNAQIAQRNAAFENAAVNLQGGTGLTTTIAGKAGLVRRQQAVEIGNLTMEAQALQGNITAAKQIAKETIDMQYADQQDRINNQKNLISLNYNNFTASEKKRADALKYALDREQARIDEEKQTKTDISNVMIEAAKNGADQATLDKIKKSATVFDAISATGNYLSTIETKGGNYSIVDVNGESMIFDKDLGTLTPTTSTTSQTYFTDANGINWNLEGWAVDPTKAQQMQSISDRIGKVDDSNIDAKVRQFTPGLTADMIRETSAKTGVSWEALMAMVNQESAGGTSNVARNNNNYAGLTWTDGTQWQQQPYGGTKGTARPAAEGGNYIKFPTPQQGLDAMGALMAQKGTVIPKDQQIDSEVAGYVERVNSGKLTDAQALNEITPSKKKALIEVLATTPKPTDEASVVQAKDQVAKINNLVKSPALKDAVGTNFFGRDWGRFDLSKVTGDYQAFIGGVSNLVDQLSLDKLIQSKAQGATFGALSDNELRMLGNAATSINNWAEKDKNGKVKGYNISEKQFKKELETIKTLYTRVIELKSDTTIRTMNDGSVWQINPDGTLTQL